MAQIEGATSSSTDNNQSTTTNDKDGNGNGSGVPLLHQYDERWASVDYPPTGSNIAQAGCGPTSFAMVARWYGVDITPVDTCQYAADNGYHVSNGTTAEFFPDAAQHWGFEIIHTDSQEQAKAALQSGFPVIANHGQGLFTNNGHYIVYAKLVGDDGLIVNDPNCQGGGPNNHADDYVWSLSEVFQDNANWGFSAFIPTTPHDGKKPLFDCQSAAGKDGGGGGGGLRNSPFVQGFKGFKYIPHGSSVTIIKLPLGKTPCEPIYPDYVTVGDTAPKWALDKAADTIAQDSAVESGKAIPDGDSGIEAPNGMHYSSADIKQTMDANPGMTQEEAINQLSQEEKYTKPVKRNDNGTFDYVDGGTGGDSSNNSGSSDQPSAQGTPDGASATPSAKELEEHLEASREKQKSLMQNCNQAQKTILNELLQRVNSVGGAGADAERNAINYLLNHLNVDSTKMLANPEPLEPSSEYPVGVGDTNQRLRSEYESASAEIDKLIDADDPTKNK